MKDHGGAQRRVLPWRNVRAPWWRTRVITPAVVLVLAVVAIGAVLLMRLVEPDGTYRVTVINAGVRQVSGGTLVVGAYRSPQVHAIPRLSPGGHVG